MSARERGEVGSRQGEGSESKRSWTRQLTRFFGWEESKPAPRAAETRELGRIARGAEVSVPAPRMAERAPLPPQPPPLPEIFPESSALLDPESREPLVLESSPAAGPAVLAEAAELSSVESPGPAPAAPRAPITGVRPRAPAEARPTLVRLSARGALLAARGPGAARLANAAGFMHGLAEQIASDLGCAGPVNVHLHGHAKSLSVVHSEVDDIAAAYGSTRRVTSVLSKVGIR